MAGNKFIFKLGAILFILTFVYMFLASILLKNYGLMPIYGIFTFFVSFFLFALGTFPRNNDIQGWLLFLSLIMISVGGGIAFNLTFLLKYPLNNIIVTCGGLAFMLGIIIMIISIILSQKK